MAENINLYNALDDCIERMDEGATLEEVLRDYPDYADDLRELLQVAQLVTQAEVPTDETLAALGRTRQRVKFKTGERRFGGRRLMAYVAAAVLAFGVVGTGGLFYAMILPSLGGPNTVAENALQGDFAATATAIIAGATGTVEAQRTADPSAFAGSNLTPTRTDEIDPFQATATAIVGEATREAAFIITSTASMRGGTAEPVVTSVAGMDGSVALSATGTPIALATRGDAAIDDSTVFPRIDATDSTMAIQVTPPAGFNPRTQQPPPSQLPPTATPRGTVTPFAEDYQPPQLEPLNAGAIDDNANYDDYLLYRRNFLQAFPAFETDVDISMRQVITVTDADGHPVLGATVTLRDPDSNEIAGFATTYADGRTFFFPNATISSRGLSVYDVTVQVGSRVETFTLDLREGPTWTVELPNDPQANERVQLDVAFVLDSTGSMADELAELQNNILNIAEQIDALGVDTRYGLVIYRDQSDAYNVITTPFTTDVREFQSVLADVEADGGGDYPESVNRALHEAVNTLNWRDGDTVRLAFLVADAPPHFRDEFRYDVEMRNALAAGIKINPIASSGLDQIGEYVFRQLAQYTNGTFIFLTYEDADPQTDDFEPGGDPGEERGDLAAGDDPADFTVEQLDALVLQLIAAEIADRR